VVMMAPLRLLLLPLMMTATQTAASDYSTPSHSLRAQVTHSTVMARTTHHMSRLTRQAAQPRPSHLA
jgi:hypothetical protein